MDTDVAIIGGGPAGSATAIFLTRAGHRVVILEKDAFPRFHIGESLLPAALPILRDLGVDLAEGCHQFKAGARFMDEPSGQAATYLFRDGLPGGHPDHAYQVDREVFDQELLNLARAAGVDVREGVRVQDVSVDASGVRLDTQHGDLQARFLVDASGQSAFLARRNQTLRPIRTFGRGAAFVHYKGLSSAAWDEIQPRGNTEILRVGSGWAWAIPLSDRRLSVGVVAREGAMRTDQVFDFVASSPLLRRWTEGAEAGPPHLVGDYSFRNDSPYGTRFVCVGDSACFLDPVFSAGVTLGLAGAQSLASILGPALDAGEEGREDLMGPLSDHMQRAYRPFYALIYRFYNTAILDNLLFAEAPEPTYRAGLITMLSGDVWRSDNSFQDMVTTSTRHALAEF